MLIVDIILYFFLALYVDNVIPTQYGQRRSPYFIFLPSFWKSLFNGRKKEGLNREMSAREQETSEDIETVHADMHGNEAIRYTNNWSTIFFNNYTKTEGLCAKWLLDISLVFQCVQN